MTPAPFTVVSRRFETADTATLDVVPSTGAVEPLPGQFMMLYAFGVGEAPISVSGCPEDDGLMRHTVRGVGAVTRALVAMEPGAVVGARGPFGAGWPVSDAAGHDLLLIAGGIGLAPLRPVVRRVVRDRGRFGRVTLIVGARTPSDLLFRRELAEWRGRFDLDVEITVDAAEPDWRGDVGVVTKLLPRVPLDPSRSIAMVCGPEVMMRVVARWLLDADVPADRIHVSLERNMQCGIGRCGHCQLGPVFVCTNGPVVPWSRAAPLLEVRGW